MESYEPSDSNDQRDFIFTTTASGLSFIEVKLLSLRASSTTIERVHVNTNNDDSLVDV